MDLAGFNFAPVVAAHLASLPAPHLSLSDVIRVYTGKTGCLCGCRGRYYTTKEMAERHPELINSASVSPSGAARAVAAINASSRAARRSEGLGEHIIELAVSETKVIVAYVLLSADVSAFAEEQ